MAASARRFEDQHVVVTGAGSGIGRAIAARMAKEGARVTMLGRRKDALAETERMIQAAQPATVCSLSVDIRDARAVEEGFARATRELGPIQACVANSGIGGPNEPGKSDRFE